MYLIIFGCLIAFIITVALSFWIKQSLISRSPKDQSNIQQTFQLCKRSLFTVQRMEDNIKIVQEGTLKQVQPSKSPKYCVKCSQVIQSSKQMIQNNNGYDQLLYSPPPKQKENQQFIVDPITMSFRKFERKEEVNERNEESLQSILNELQFCKAQLEQSQHNQSQLRQRLFKLLQELHAQRTQSNRIKDQYSNELRHRQEQTKNMESIIKHLKEQNQHYKANQIKSRLLIDSPSRSSILSNSRNKHFLNECRFILDQEKQYLVRHFKGLNLNVLKTQILYKFEKLHPRNPHLSIDGIKNIILVIQLINGKALAAFSSKSYTFANDDKQLGQAFIFDLSRKKTFTGLKQCIHYDDKNLVWGQQALMIKENQPRILFSNIQKTSFWDGRTSFQEFLGTPRNWAEINHYQIHQIQFQN